MNQKEQYFFECGTYDCRMADGIFDTIDEAKAAAQAYAFEQGLTDEPIKWTDYETQSIAVVGGYDLTITLMIEGVVNVHDDLETYGRFEPDNFDEG